ncbi:MAG: hypothetical protein Q8R40_03890 [bacterium]|nr:hypothetical protein [bacterium]
MTPQEKIENRAAQLTSLAAAAGVRMAQIGRTNSLIDELRREGKIPAEKQADLKGLCDSFDITLPEGYTAALVQACQMKLEAMPVWLRREHRELRACARLEHRHAKALRSLAKKYVNR